MCLANIQIVKMFELFENERTKTIHSSIVHSSEIRGLCLLICHIFGNQNLLSYYSMKDQGVSIIEKIAQNGKKIYVVFLKILWFLIILKIWQIEI